MRIEFLRRLERWWRRLALRTIARFMRGRRRDALPDWDARPYRVLLLRPDRIGDMILTTGLIRAIARSHPTIALDVLASPTNAPLLRGNPHVQRVLRFVKGRPLDYPRLWRELRASRYDAVIDCMITAPSLTTLLLMLASGAEERIGIAERGSDFAYTIPVPGLAGDGHLVDHLSALATAFGVSMSGGDFRPEIFLDDDERRDAAERWLAAGATSGARRLLLNVSAGIRARRWSAERYVQILAFVRERFPDVVTIVIGAPDDSALADDIAGRGGAHYARTPSLRAALALIASADAVVSPDTSVVHAADAFGVPVVAMFQQRHLLRWGPRGAEARTVATRGKTLDEIPVEPVLAAVGEMLEGARG